MSELYLCADGTVESRPSPAKVADAARRGVNLITSGELCTACLVGTWGRSHLRLTQTLCDECTWLEAEVSRRAGTGLSRAGRRGPGELRPGGERDRDDAAWAPIRAARVLREEQVSRVFVRASALGASFVDLTTTDGRVLPVLSYADVERLNLLPRGAEERARRFAEWLRALAPEDHAARSAELADVHALAHALHAHEADTRRQQARADLARATRDTAKAATTLGRAPRVLGAAAARVLQVRFAPTERHARA